MACAPVLSVSAGFVARREEVVALWSYTPWWESECVGFRIEVFRERVDIPGVWDLVGKEEASRVARMGWVRMRPGMRFHTCKVKVTVLCRDCTESEGVESDPFGPE